MKCSYALMILAACYVSEARTSSGQHSPIPPKIIQIVPNGIDWRPMSIQRVWQLLLTDDVNKLQKIAENDPERFELQYLRLATNTIRIISAFPEHPIVEVTTSHHDGTYPGITIRYGQTSRFAWEHRLQEPLPIVLPFDEPLLNDDSTANAILNSQKARNAGNNHILERLGLPWLGDVDIQHISGQEPFLAQKNGLTIPISAKWIPPELHLKYSKNAESNNIVYHAVLKFRAADFEEYELASVNIYNAMDMENDVNPKALLAGFKFEFDENVGATKEQASNPMMLFGWREWVEFHQGRWVRRTIDGHLMDFPGFGQAPSRRGLTSWVVIILIISSGAVCLLLARGVWHKMAKQRHNNDRRS